MSSSYGYRVKALCG